MFEQNHSKKYTNNSHPYNNYNSTSSLEDEDVDKSNTLLFKRPSTRDKSGRKKTHLRVNRALVYLFIGITFVLFLLLVIDIKLKFDTKTPSSSLQQQGQTSTWEKKTESCSEDVYCPDVLRSATAGTWRRQPDDIHMSWKQQNIEDIREHLQLPKNMSRTDFRCGIHFPISQTRLAALCDPSGDTYCCCESTGFCGKTDEHCKQKTSVNMLDVIPEQRAVWIPANSKCNLKQFSPSEACQVLNKAVKKIVFLGDSQARQFFTSLVLLLTGQYTNGAIQEEHKDNNYVTDNCSDSYQILNNHCRRFLVKSTRELKTLCGTTGTETPFELEYFANFESFVSKKTADMYESLYDQKDTYVIVGAGTHFNSDYGSFLAYYFKYMVTQKEIREWPRYMVETLHDVYSPTSTEKRTTFNQMVVNAAEELKSEVFDNSQLSRLLESHDGRTYGMKFHMMKANILVHYMQNLISCQR